MSPQKEQNVLDKPSRILKHLYLGSKVHAKDKVLLKKLNITHVVNCSPPRSVDKKFGIPNYFKNDGDITYLRVPIFDNKGEDITPWLDKVYHFINHARHYGNTLVHCLRGVSRSATFVMSYLMKDNDFSMDEALSHVVMCRSIVQPNDAFLAQLRKYDNDLRLAKDNGQKNAGQFTTTIPCVSVQIKPSPCPEVKPESEFDVHGDARCTSSHNGQQNHHAEKRRCDTFDELQDIEKKDSNSIDDMHHVKKKKLEVSADEN